MNIPRRMARISAGEEVEKLEPWCVAGGNVMKWCGHHGKQHGSSSGIVIQ